VLKNVGAVSLMHCAGVQPVEEQSKNGPLLNRTEKV
jgi:hypothetical protein